MKETITQFQKDQLTEVVNIGASKAAMSLSEMIGDRRVEIGVPSVFIDVAEKIPGFIEDKNNLETVILIRLSGEVSGVLMLTIPAQAALKVASLITVKHEESFPLLDEFCRVALGNTGKAFGGAIVDSFSGFLGLKIEQSEPDTITDKLGPIVDSVAAYMSSRSNIAMAFRVDVLIEVVPGEHIEGQLFFVFEPSSTDIILEALKTKFPNI